MENENKNTEDQNNQQQQTSSTNNETPKNQAEDPAAQTSHSQPEENASATSDEQVSSEQQQATRENCDMLGENGEPMNFGNFDEINRPEWCFRRPAVVQRTPWYIRLVWFLRRIFTRRVASIPMHPRNQWARRVTTSPYVIVVRNKNNKPTKFSLFNSYESRVADNFGNPEGIEISNGAPHVTYHQILGQLEVRPTSFGNIYMQVIEGANSSISTPLSHIKADANGHMQIRPIFPQLDPYQQIANVLEHFEIFNVDGGTEISGEMPAMTAVEYFFYPYEPEPVEKVGFWKRFFRAITFQNRKKAAKYALAV